MAIVYEAPTPLSELTPLVGTWRMQARFPRDRDHVLTGTCVFEWLHGQQVLVQRTEPPAPMPASIAVIARDTARDGYLQHYFDSRGVVRLYEMTFTGGVWTLVRTQPDFSPLDFAQRYVGKLVGTTIRGSWQKKPVDADVWELDIELDFHRM